MTEGNPVLLELTFDLPSAWYVDLTDQSPGEEEMLQQMKQSSTFADPLLFFSNRVGCHSHRIAMCQTALRSAERTTGLAGMGGSAGGYIVESNRRNRCFAGTGCSLLWGCVLGLRYVTVDVLKTAEDIGCGDSHTTTLLFLLSLVLKQPLETCEPHLLWETPVNVNSLRICCVMALCVESVQRQGIREKPKNKQLHS